MENLQHQLLVTPTLVPLSASLTARNRTHAHVAKTGFGLSVVCFFYLMQQFFGFLCCCVFAVFRIRNYLSGSVSGSGSGSGDPRIRIRRRIRLWICIFPSTNKKILETLLSTVLWLFNAFFIFEDWCKSISKSDKQKLREKKLIFCWHVGCWKLLMKRAGSGSVLKCYGSGTLDLYVAAA